MELEAVVLDSATVSSAHVVLVVVDAIVRESLLLFAADVGVFVGYGFATQLSED